MAAINFPDSPTLNQRVTLGGYVWEWNGTTWRKLNTGKSAYDVAVENGFVGTEAQWLASLVGADGAAGATGATGPQGPAGAPTRTIRSVSSSTTLQSGDLNQAVRFTGTSAQVLTVNDVLTPGTSVEVIQDNSGSVEFQSGAGVTLLSSTGFFKAKGQNSFVTLKCVASGQYRITGDVTTVPSPLATGGTISITNDYIYHTFTSNGSFVPEQPLNVEYLVIAGGGSGSNGDNGNDGGGGGGAGGLLYASATNVSTSSSIVIGAGGAGLSGTFRVRGNSGSNSSFLSSTAVGGGYAGRCNENGGPGGSGGGAGGGGGSSPFSGGTATAGQGYNGGTNSGTAPYTGSGGGGSAAVGGNSGGGLPGGNGGAGTSTYSSWLSVVGAGVSGAIAGGGAGGGGITPSLGGGNGGAGGGGNGGTHSDSGTLGNGQNAVVNTGSGGGGSGNKSAVSGSGASGIVIVRYAV